MTVAKRERENNHSTALTSMLEQLGDGAIDTTLFDSEAPSYAETVLRTTWEELTRGKYVSKVQRAQYRLTPKGWLAALELSGADQSVAYQQRLGTVLAAMKAHVKGTTRIESGRPSDSCGRVKRA